MYDVIASYAEAARSDPDIAADVRLIEANREGAFRRHLRVGSARAWTSTWPSSCPRSTARSGGRYETDSLTSQLL